MSAHGDLSAGLDDQLRDSAQQLRGAGLGYTSDSARALHGRRGNAARPATKFELNGVAWRVVLTLLDWKWSRQQAAATLQTRVNRPARAPRVARYGLHRNLPPAARRAEAVHRLSDDFDLRHPAQVVAVNRFALVATRCDVK